jgi:N-acetylmuramoyl-L-alanine amidase
LNIIFLQAGRTTALRAAAFQSTAAACAGKLQGMGWGATEMNPSRRIGTVAAVVLAMLLCHGACGDAQAEPVKPQKASGPTCDRTSFRVVLDVGHTAKAWGAISARGQHEFDFNLRLAKLIERKLIEAGFAKTTLLVTEGPSMRALHQRVARANKSSADLFLSIHHDSVPDKFLEKWQIAGKERGFCDRFKGHSIFVSHANSDFSGSLLFGKLLGKQLKARGLQYAHHYTESFMGHRQRLLVDPDAGVYRYDQLIVLKDTRMPAVLLEAGSIINRDEELAMEAPERQSLISAAAIDAVDNFCAARRPHTPDHVAGQPSVAPGSKPMLVPTAMAPVSQAKQR